MGCVPARRSTQNAAPGVTHMSSAGPIPSAQKPPIHLIDAEYDIIADLALSIERRSPELSKLLLDEIDRAEIHERGALQPGVVTIGSEVEFLDVDAGTTRKVQLVLPAEADIEAGRISILTSVGAGLIGLREGQSIDWPTPSGRQRVLRILKVARPVS